MAARRAGGARRPPPRAERLVGEYEAAVAELEAPGRLIIGGKSLGGRVASLAAQGLFDSGAIAVRYRGVLVPSSTLHGQGAVHGCCQSGFHHAYVKQRQFFAFLL